MSGLSWLAVETISSLPLLTTSQAQPLPKRPRPAASNFSLNASKLPNAALMASASVPVGAPPALGAMSVQNKVWFDVAAAVVAHRRPDVVGHRIQVGDEVLDRLAFEVGLSRDRLVQVGDVSGMMLAVVDFHRLGVDVRLQRVLRVGERR